MSAVVVEKSTFRRNFQRWVLLNYGENSRTKTITRSKYIKICRYLLGEPLIETDAKFRFWVKSKGFRIVQSEDLSPFGTLYVPVKVPHTRVWLSYFKRLVSLFDEILFWFCRVWIPCIHMMITLDLGRKFLSTDE